MEDQSEMEFGGEGTKRVKKKMKNKRRFSEDQVKWLETMFENEAKLEPRKKAEVATQLGLHPRQVAIWFQNKRARWKSKQLQHEFDALRRSYDSLASRFDLLTRENQSLSLQVQKLKKLVESMAQEHSKLEASANDQESKSDNDSYGMKPMSAIEGSIIREEGDHDYFGMEEEGVGDLLAMVEPSCSSLTSDEEWQGLQSERLFEQSPSSCEWWEAWC